MTLQYTPFFNTGLDPGAAAADNDPAKAMEIAAVRSILLLDTFYYLYCQFYLLTEGNLAHVMGIVAIQGNC